MGKIENIVTENWRASQSSGQAEKEVLDIIRKYIADKDEEIKEEVREHGNTYNVCYLTSKKFGAKDVLALLEEE